MFDYTSNARKPQTVECTKDFFMRVVRSTKVGVICADIKDALEKVKRGEMSRADFETYKRQRKIELPAFLFQAHFSDHRRHNSSAVPSGLAILDIDHIGGQTPAPLLTEGLGKDSTAGEALKKMGIVLVHVTPSTEGLRVVFTLNDGESLQDGQKRIARQLGITTFDEACKDLARCSFAVPEDYILYMDDEGLFNTSTTNYPPPSPPVREGGLNTSTAEKPTHKSNHSPLRTEGSGEVVPGETVPGEAALSIFDSCVAAAGLSAANLNNIGTRHNSLITILSMGICRLMTQEQLRAVVARRMPEYSNERDCQDLIRDFYEKYTDPNRPMSEKLRKIYADSLKTSNPQSSNPKSQSSNPKSQSSNPKSQTEEDIDDGKDDEKEEKTAALIKTIMKRLPQGLKESVEGVPDNMKMPVICAVLPIAAAYADGVTVRYCDGGVQRLGLMSIIVGPQASGKSACKKKVDLWERQMKDEDARAREIEDRWKEARKAKKANEKSPEDPMVLIRSVPATISCSTLLKRLKNSRGHCLWTFCEELDTLRKSNGAGSWSSKYDIYRLSFDYGEWGQDYNSDQAVSGVVNVAYNFAILGTYGALRKCFRADNVENGLSSRIIVSEMPDAAFAPMPSFGQTSADAAAAIDRAVTLLRSKTGFVDTPRLRKTIGEWVEQKRIEAMADGDLVKDTYRKRAAVIGFRCGVVAYLLTGKESAAVADFATLMAQYVLDEQMKIFGNSLKDEYKKASDEQLRTSVNQSIFDQLPPVFTLQDLRQMKGPDTANHSLRVIISRWKHAGWIHKTAVNQWKKELKSE